MSLWESGMKCYGLDMKCPQQVYVLMACLQADKILGSNWIMRALT
jgi:hypothetical protein